jgi:uncharacterized membrane protein
MDLKNAKLMGGVGAILSVLVFIPKVGWLFAITGLVLVLLAIKEISNAVNNKKIFDNYLIAFILDLIGSFVVVAIAGIATFLGVFRLRAIPNLTMRGMMNGQRLFSNFDGRFFGAGIIAIIVALIVALALVIIASYFTKLSFEGIANGTRVEYFKTSGMLIFIGSFLLVVFGIGAIVMFVGAILEIVGFFSLPDRLEKPVLETSPGDSPSLNQ